VGRPANFLALSHDPHASRRGRPLAALLAILAVTAAVYARALKGQLVYDDLLLIARNPLIADLGNLPRLFTSGYWDFLGLKDAEHIGYWRPLTAIVQALIWPLGGSAPGYYHAACIAIHLGAVTAAFYLARALTRSTWIAAATALLFALHPAHVESVAWISALNDPLFGCLALACLERFVAWRRHGSRGLPWVATLFFALALLSKELGAALVPLIFLVDLLRPREPGADDRPWLPAGAPRFLRETVGPAPAAPARAYAPFALVFGLYLLARMLVFSSPLAGFDRVTTDFGVGLGRLLLLRLELFGGGIEILCLPIDLNLFRPFRPHIELLDPALVRATVFSAVFLALLVACCLGRRRTALAALIFVPAGLLPALIRVESLGVFPLSDRFLYLPVFGFALALALLLGRLSSRVTASTLLLLLSGLYAVRCVTRIAVWKDEETLFRRSAEQSPRSVYVLWGLGRVLLERHNETNDPRYVQEALAVFERATQLLTEAKQPDSDLFVTSRDYLQVNLGFAWCYIYTDQAAGAVAALEELAKRIETLRSEAQEARANGMRVREQFLDLEQVYTALGAAHARAGDEREAEEAFRKSLELQPAVAETHQNLGRLLMHERRWEEARAEFEAASRLRPGNAEDRLLLAQALQTLGENEEAARLARQLLDELPGRAEPLVVLATGALGVGDASGALVWLDRALTIDPRNALAWYQKARAQLLRNDPREAVTAFRNAIDLDPSSFEAHYDFGAFLLSQGALEEARPLLEHAYGLAPPEHRAPLRNALSQLTFPAADEPFRLALDDWNRKEFEPALAWVERALALAPDHTEALLMKARILQRNGQPDQALALLERCTQLVPQSFTVWSEYGELCYQQEQVERGRAALERALEIGPPPAWPDELRQGSIKNLERRLEGQEPQGAIIPLEGD